MGRLPTRGYQGENRRWFTAPGRYRIGRSPVVVAALYRWHPAVPERNVAVARASRPSLTWISTDRQLLRRPTRDHRVLALVHGADRAAIGAKNRSANISRMRAC